MTAAAASSDLADANAVRGVAAFDFDGTISRRDTLGGFLIAVAGRPAVLRAMARRGPAMARSLADDVLRDLTKASLLTAVLGGRSEQDLIAAGQRYAATLTHQLRPEALERIRWHQGLGHELVIVSASLAYYLEPVAQTLGIDHVIGVEMATDERGRLTGKMRGANVRADEKPRRLLEWMGDEGMTRREVWAYGNSSGDDALLAAADHPTWLGRRAGRQPR